MNRKAFSAGPRRITSSVCLSNSKEMHGPVPLLMYVWMDSS